MFDTFSVHMSQEPKLKNPKETRNLKEWFNKQKQSHSKFPGAITPSFNASECKIYAKWDKNCFRQIF